jgi:hypothetical protein
MLLGTILRILLVLTGACFGLLGYRLFVLGMKSGTHDSGIAGRIPTSGRGSMGAGLFLIVMAGLIVSGVSLTRIPTWPGFLTRSLPAARPTDRARLLRQLEVLKQTGEQNQRVIADLRAQLASAQTNEGLSPMAVSQMGQSLDAATENIDFNELYAQMMEWNDLVTALQSENETLRAENAALRGESPAPRSEAAPR